MIPTSNRFVLVIGVILVWTVGVFTHPVHADDMDQGSATATYLKLDPSAKSAALGSAYLGRSNTVSTYFNPAGLGFLRQSGGFVTQNDIFANITYRHLALSYPVEVVDGGVGISLTNLDYGQQQRTQIRNQDPITGLGQFGANDLSFTTSFGWRLLSTLSVGGSLKYVSSDIAGYQDGTVSGDIGLQYRTPVPRLNIGMAGRNLFGKLELNQRADPLPRVWEFGANYRLPISPGYHEFDLGAGGGFSIDADEYFFGGIEYNIYRVGALRFGYRGEQEAGEGLTFGGGLHYSGFGVNYAYVPFGELGKQQRFTLSYDFGPTRTKRVKEQEEPPETQVPELPQPADMSLADRLDRAQRFYRNRETQKAYDILRELHRDVPQNTVVLLWLGLVEYKLGQRESALERMRRVLEIDPGNTYARENLKRLKPQTTSQKSTARDRTLSQARRLFRNERYEKAQIILNDLLEEEPENLDVLFWLGRTEYELGEESDARDRMLKILELNPESDRARRTLLRMD
jgi:tetratricopeptide (TPR) repeat protein